MGLVHELAEHLDLAPKGAGGYRLSVQQFRKGLHAEVLEARVLGGYTHGVPVGKGVVVSNCMLGGYTHGVRCLRGDRASW